MTTQQTIDLKGTVFKLVSVSASDGVIDQKQFGTHEPHFRAKNWIAIVIPNRAIAGGLERTFLDRVRGKGAFYATEGVQPGDFLEVGADYITTGGRRHPKRAYFRVLVQEDVWLLREATMPEDKLDIIPYEEEVAALFASEAS